MEVNILANIEVDVVDQRGQYEVASVDPDHHVKNEKEYCSLFVFRFREELSKAGSDVGDIMQERDYRADIDAVDQVAAAEEVDGDNVMQGHLDKVISPLAEKVQE